MMRYVKILLTSTLLLFIATAAIAADRINTLDRKGLFGYKESGIALRGYDTVAYFTVGKPLEGKDQFSTEWMEATWKFASQEHLDLFVAEPEKYAPQYGGYCAYGVAQDALVKIEPELWTVIDEKLYLNYDDDVQQKWEKDIPAFIVDADAKFDALIN